MVCLRCHHFTRKLQIILFCHKRAKLESSVSGVAGLANVLQKMRQCITVYFRFVWSQIEIGTPITACPVQGNQIGIMAINIYCNVSLTNSSG